MVKKNVTGEHEQAAWDWLKNLDGGRGSLSLGPHSLGQVAGRNT